MAHKKIEAFKLKPVQSFGKTFIKPLIPLSYIYPKGVKDILFANPSLIDYGGWFCAEDTAKLLEYAFTIKHPNVRLRKYKKFKYDFIQFPLLLIKNRKKIDPISIAEILAVWPQKDKLGDFAAFRPFVFLNMLAAIPAPPFVDRSIEKWDKQWVGAILSGEILAALAQLGKADAAVGWIRKMERKPVARVFSNLMMVHGKKFLAQLKDEEIIDLLLAIDEFYGENPNEEKMDNFVAFDGRAIGFRKMNRMLSKKSNEIIDKLGLERGGRIKHGLREVKSQVVVTPQKNFTFGGNFGFNSGGD